MVQAKQGGSGEKPGEKYRKVQLSDRGSQIRYAPIAAIVSTLATISALSGCGNDPEQVTRRLVFSRFPASSIVSQSVSTDGLTVCGEVAPENDYSQLYLINTERQQIRFSGDSGSDMEDFIGECGFVRGSAVETNFRQRWMKVAAQRKYDREAKAIRDALPVKDISNGLAPGRTHISDQWLHNNANDLRTLKEATDLTTKE